MPSIDLFAAAIDFDISKASGPLADRMRPQSLAEFIGQEHLLGEDKVLRRMIEEDKLASIIFWGPPGSGKTTLANVIAKTTGHFFSPFSAVFSGIKEVRSVMERAHTERHIYDRKALVFVDEIHRFNKAQQDGFLPFVERGDIVLIGATTENPSFEVNAALLSRMKVFVLYTLSPDHITQILKNALANEKNGLGAHQIVIDPQTIKIMALMADGDARSALNTLERAFNLARTEADGSRMITTELVYEAAQAKMLRYDKDGEEHYNLISAFIKSLRGSDPDAAIYWLVRMLEAGEDPLYIARRMIVFAAEDVSNADPQALTIALNAREATDILGKPECQIPLAQAVVYLATAPKSNASYAALNAAKQTIQETGTLPVPLHIRNAPTKLMKALDYGKDYKYAHDHPEHYLAQEYLPAEIRGSRFYVPGPFGFEKEIEKRLKWWAKKKQEQMEES